VVERVNSQRNLTEAFSRSEKIGFKARLDEEECLMIRYTLQSFIQDNNIDLIYISAFASFVLRAQICKQGLTSCSRRPWQSFYSSS